MEHTDFLKIDGIRGDNNVPGRPGYIEVLSFYYPQLNGGHQQGGGPGTIGELTEITIVAKKSAASRRLISAKMSGEIISNAVLEVVDDGGKLRYSVIVENLLVEDYMGLYPDREDAELVTLFGRIRFAYGSPPPQTVQPQHRALIHETRGKARLGAR